MKLTKYEHACFTVQKDDQILVVDPGIHSTDFLPPENVVAVVITHEHGDHFDHDQLAAIVDKNPQAVIVGPESVTSKIEVFDTKTVNAGDKMSVGLFTLEFFGGQHAIVHTGIATVQNVGVMINDLIYYGGDSFTLPGRSVDTLALPAGAPWLKISEAMDYLTTVKPRFAFPTHDAVLSDAGKFYADRILGQTATQNGIEYKRLNSPIEV